MKVLKNHVTNNEAEIIIYLTSLVMWAMFRAFHWQACVPFFSSPFCLASGG